MTKRCFGDNYEVMSIGAADSRKKNEGQCSGSQGLRYFVKRTEHYHENVGEDLVVTYYVHSTVSSLGWSEGGMVLGKTSSVGR